MRMTLPIWALLNRHGRKRRIWRVIAGPTRGTVQREAAANG